jgi:X-Pro dipeptidyl-peptidase
MRPARNRSRIAFRTGVALLAAAVVVPLASLTATAGPDAAPSKPFVEGTRTVAAYDYGNAIRPFGFGASPTPAS